MNTEKPINIGLIGAGYMGKAHAVAMQAVGSVFNLSRRPHCEMICTRSEAGAAAKAKQLGFARSTGDWRVLIADPAVDAVIIASQPEGHHDMAALAFQHGKPVLCEKPLAATLAEARQMTELAQASGVPHMVGFNYIRTPASQLAHEIIAAGEIGEILYFRGEHTEDFYADPALPANWRAFGKANGAMGDLAPHMINAALALVGPIEEIIAEVSTAIPERAAEDGQGRIAVSNDDFGHMLCRFANGARGHMLFSRIAHGRKMGYIYEITGSKGALRFNQEDQNSLWLYEASARSSRAGFRQILTGPEHPDYVNFCLGPGHGTGYQDQIIIEAKDFIGAILNRKSVFPDFADGLAVAEIVEAAFISQAEQRWVDIASV